MRRFPLIIGHRGASSHAPENTLAAFQKAIDAGADGLEFDVQLARDGVPVVIHDRTLKRTGLTNESVANLTSGELGRIDVGSWFNTKFPRHSDPTFASERIPTLAQVLDLCRDYTGLMYIELKVNVQEFRPLAAAVCDVIRNSPRLSQMIVKSFKLAAIPEIRHHLPEVQTAALFAPKILEFLRRRNYLIEVAKEFDAHQISLHHSLVTRKLSSLAKDAKMPVTIWTADNTKWIDRCGKLGIRSLITNNPARFIHKVA